MVDHNGIRRELKLYVDNIAEECYELENRIDKLINEDCNIDACTMGIAEEKLEILNKVKLDLEEILNK